MFPGFTFGFLGQYFGCSKISRKMSTQLNLVSNKFDIVKKIPMKIFVLLKYLVKFIILCFKTYED